MTISISKAAFALHPAQIAEIIKLIQAVRSGPGVIAAYDPASVAAGATTAATTFTVTGAAINDIVSVEFSLDRQGLDMVGWVSAANTVSVVTQNPTAGTVDLAAGTITIRTARLV